MSKGQYEHFMAFIEKAEDGDATDFNLVPVAIDLDPDKAVSMRQLGVDEGLNDLSEYVTKAKKSMHDVTDRMVDQVLEAKKVAGGTLPEYGFVDLVMQLQDAPHLLIANMLAAMIAQHAEDVDPHKVLTEMHDGLGEVVAVQNS